MAKQNPEISVTYKKQKFNSTFRAEESTKMPPEVCIHSV